MLKKPATLLNFFMKGLAFGLGICAAGVAAVTVSGTITAFSEGQTVSAASINANFSALKSAIEGVPDHTAVSVDVSGFTIPNTTPTTITFINENDPGNLHPANSSRLTVPSDGFYLVVAVVDFPVNPTNNRVVRIIHNGVMQILDDDEVGATIPVHTNNTVLHHFSAGDFVELQATQHSGAPMNITASFALIKLSN